MFNTKQRYINYLSCINRHLGKMFGKFNKNKHESQLWKTGSGDARYVYRKI